MRSQQLKTPSEGRGIGAVSRVAPLAGEVSPREGLDRGGAGADAAGRERGARRAVRQRRGQCRRLGLRRRRAAQGAAQWLRVLSKAVREAWSRDLPEWSRERASFR